VSEVVIRAQGKVVGPVTVSIGLATYPQHGSTPEELMRAADDALYRAKHEGRNRVLAAE
jgi:diguanylate cyclase (GGDEF)-like protein